MNSSLPTLPISRRRFCQGVAGLGASFALPRLARAATDPGRYALTAFSKAFQELGPDATANWVEEVGWNGIECPVRKHGQIEPDRVEEDLPKMVAALKARRQRIVCIATDIPACPEALTERVLRTASRLGIRLYRLAHFRYAANIPIPQQIDEFRRKILSLRPLNQELRISAAYENHCGSDSFGAPVWDIYELLKDADPHLFGINFDIGHATIEGGSAWPIHFRLIRPWLKAVYVKDFVWRRRNRRWEHAWCPLGQGLVDPRFFTLLKQSNYRGPIVQHFEYPTGEGKAKLEAMRRDLRTLKSWLAKA